MVSEKKERYIPVSLRKPPFISYPTELVMQLSPSSVTDADRAVIGKYAAESGNLAAQKAFLICMNIRYCFDTFTIAKLKIAKHQNMTETRSS